MRTFLTSIFALAFSSAIASSFPSDSLTIEQREGKSFVVHKVTEGETLYSLLRRYHCSSEDALLANIELKGNSTILLNQVLRFPVPQKEKESVILLGKNGKFREVETITKTPQQLHQVIEGETLYSIGKKYGIDAQKLKEINVLDDNSIAAGQKLIVSENYQPIGPAGDEVAPKKKNIKKVTLPSDYVPNAPRGIHTNEVGIAMAINTNKTSGKILALHRFAPIGSFIKVTNEGNGSSLMVKVLGRLPDTGINQDVLIRLSPSAFQKLQPRDSRIRVAVSYELSPN